MQPRRKEEEGEEEKLNLRNLEFKLENGKISSKSGKHKIKLEEEKRECNTGLAGKINRYACVHREETEPYRNPARLMEYFKKFTHSCF